VSTGLLWMALVLSVPALAQNPVDRAVEATVCDLAQQPSKYIGKRVQVRVQEGLSGPGIVVLHEPLRPDFKVDFLVYGKECALGVDFKGTPPADWILTEGLAYEGPILRQFPIDIYGPEATVVGRLRYSHMPAREPTIVRDQNGKIVATHFYPHGPSNPEPELKLVIERVLEDR